MDQTLLERPRATRLRAAPEPRFNPLRVLWPGCLLAAFAMSAVLTLPGQIPLDSVSALWEGRHHVRMTWGPPMYSAILGAFDAIAPGTGLLVVASMSLLLLAWAALPGLRRRASWAGLALLAFWLATPELLVFQGIVWRDVLCANLTIGGFVALAAAERDWTWPPRRWPMLVLAAVCLALAALVRQNAGVTLLPAALAIAWTARRAGVWRALLWSVGSLAVVAGLALTLNALVPIRNAPHQRPNIGPRLLQQYDLLGALAANPSRPMATLQRARPDKLGVLRQASRATYSPVRSDTIDQHLDARKAFWRFSDGAIDVQWRETIAQDPAGYLRRRLEVFRWVFLTPDLAQCVPVFTGVSGIPKIERDLGLSDGVSAHGAWLGRYAQAWFRTPLYSHLTYALLACASAAFLLRRRSPADVTIAAMLLGALIFAVSFFVLSIACDYRYLYLLDLAAITGTLYIAVDPTLRTASPDPAAS